MFAKMLKDCVGCLDDLAGSHLRGNVTQAYNVYSMMVVCVLVT